VCGTDLNTGTCDCEHHAPPSPFDALADLGLEEDGGS
jgi:uncharacterized metal-binding protein YceD (DUF177 family)